VFALATPKSPIDRGGRWQLQLYHLWPHMQTNAMVAACFCPTAQVGHLAIQLNTWLPLQGKEQICTSMGSQAVLPAPFSSNTQIITWCHGIQQQSAADTQLTRKRHSQYSPNASTLRTGTEGPEQWHLLSAVASRAPPLRPAALNPSC
jgi:hypothetical protein